MSILGRLSTLSIVRGSTVHFCSNLLPAFAGPGEMIVDLSQLSEPRSLHLQFFLQFQSFYLAIHLQPLGLSEGHVGVVHLLTWRGIGREGSEGEREGESEGRRKNKIEK